jgi:hypothetical protein
LKWTQPDPGLVRLPIPPRRHCWLPPAPLFFHVFPLRPPDENGVIVGKSKCAASGFEGNFIVRARGEGISERLGLNRQRIFVKLPIR